MFHKWKRGFNEQGAIGLEPQYRRVDPGKRQMEQEIKRLRELVSRYEFDSFLHADMKIAQYIFTYNHIRKHGSLGLRTPDAVWNEYFFRQS